MADFKRVLGSNNYQTDPLSLGDPTKAISSRGDLSADKPSLYGAVDLKVTEVEPGTKSWDGTAWARCGPTTDNQPPFSWLNIPDSEPILHLGQPAVFNFTFVAMPFSDATGVHPLLDSRPGLRKSPADELRAAAEEVGSRNLAEWPLALLLCSAGLASSLLALRARWRRSTDDEGAPYHLQS